MAHYHHTCRRCGRTFDSRRSTGVSFLLKEKYCSRRCEAAAKKHDSDFYKRLSKKSKISMIVGIILIVLLLITTKNDKPKAASQSEIKISNIKEKKSKKIETGPNKETVIKNEELKEETVIDQSKISEQENVVTEIDTLEEKVK